MRRAMPWLTGLVLLMAGCSTASGPSSATGSPAPRPTPTTSSTMGVTGTAASVPGAVSAFEEELRARLQTPALPSFAIPTDLLNSAEGRDISQRLRLTPGLYEGIAVLGARCDAKGVEHSIDVGSGRRAVGTAGSYKKGNISVTVKANGTGVYNAPGVHVAVLDNGSGVYERGAQRLSIESDGEGTFSDGDRRLNVRVDGSGSYTDSTSRFWVGADGAGGYRDQNVRVSVSADGVVDGNASAEQRAVIARLIGERLPRFPPVPTIRRVKATGRVCGTVIRLDANALFAFGSADLRPDARTLVDRVARLLTVVRPKTVQVNGYTDHIGTAAANLDLSVRRATAVRDELAGKGVPSGSMTLRGRGESDPIARETTSAGADLPSARQLNRRVEIILPTR
ncbi:MAG TPA: OmpA family protein [Kineosporiaceae bacterium]|nr:OmpA family protein [Kineosporiaceae bacterium]